MGINSWAFELENTIFSIIKVKATKLLKDKYPNIYFTTTNINENTPKYPTVYIHELGGYEVGKDLEGVSINGVIETLQIEVYSNTSQSDAKYVISEVADIFKEMQFEIIAFPEMKNETNIYRSIMRVRRVIGNGDSL